METITVPESNGVNELKDHAFLKIFSSWDQFVAFLPVLVTAIVVLLVFFFLAKFAEIRLERILRKRAESKQVLVADFFGKVVWLTVFLIGVMWAMYILGLGEISGSILGAAGLTTFIVGFALKDIFENFLAGVIIAFDPPFIEGSWIEVNDIQGVVQNMSLRQTMLKTFDGQDVFIPNAIILKNPLRNYTIDGYLRKEFVIGLDYGDDLSQGLELIEKTLSETPNVLNLDGRKPIAQIDMFATSTVNVKCLFWINTFDTKVPANKIMNQAMLNVLNVLTESGHYLPADILEIKYYDPKSDVGDKATEFRKKIEDLKKGEQSGA